MVYVWLMSWRCKRWVSLRLENHHQASGGQQEQAEKASVYFCAGRCAQQKRRLSQVVAHLKGLSLIVEQQQVA